MTTYGRARTKQRGPLRIDMILAHQRQARAAKDRLEALSYQFQHEILTEPCKVNWYIETLLRVHETWQELRRAIA